MKKIVLFGATGNVGSYMTKYLVEYFANDDYEIIASGKRSTHVFQSMGVEYSRRLSKISQRKMYML